MMRRIELTATVSEDGLLTIAVPTEMRHSVHSIIIEFDDETQTRIQEDDWETFIRKTVGAWSGDFERPPQGVVEEREKL